MGKILDHGCRRIIIGIGGSATNDGGSGMAAALGVRFLDQRGYEVPLGGGNLNKIERICLKRRDPRLDETDIVVACDVNNPLLGHQGASHVYGPQKGATPSMVQELETNMVHFNQQITRFLGQDMAHQPGAGAAGGLGAGLMVFAGGRIVSGVELIMDMVQMDHLMDECHLICTGEGRLDLQTLNGKVIMGIARRAKKMKVPVIAFCGELMGEGSFSDDYPIIPFSIAEGPGTLEKMMDDAYRLLSNASQHVFQLIRQVERGWHNV
jgi:glycerate kinase